MRSVLPWRGLLPDLRAISLHLGSPMIYPPVMEERNGVRISLPERHWFVENNRAVEFMRFHAGMYERGNRRTRNFLRRTVRAAGMRSRL